MTKDSQIAEIVTFRLARGTDADKFAQAAETVEMRFRDEGHMLTRTLSCTPDGTWTDHVIWASDEAAQAAARDITRSPDCAPFLAMIDPDSVVMSHGQVARRMD